MLTCAREQIGTQVSEPEEDGKGTKLIQKEDSQILHKSQRLESVYIG